jgi:hypothetical protein
MKKTKKTECFESQTPQGTPEVQTSGVDWDDFIAKSDAKGLETLGKNPAECIAQRKCVMCGKDAPETMHMIFEAAYQISGLCEQCQRGGGLHSTLDMLFYGGLVRDFILEHGGKR